MESVSANNCRSVFASSMPTSKGKFNRCPEALGVGIRFITMKIEALGSYNEDTKIPDRLNSSTFHKSRFALWQCFRRVLMLW